MNDSPVANLGQGLQKLIGRVGSPLLRAQDITTTPANDPQRRTYRLWFQDGRELKGRYYATSRLAQVSHRIREMAGLDFLPRVVAHEGDASLEEWIVGTVLVQGDVNLSLIAQCGRALGRLHQCPPPPLADLGYSPLNVSDWVRMTLTKMEELVGANVLGEQDAQRLRELALSHRPADQRVGVVNRDMCPQNLVLDANGRVFLVDNGSLLVGSIEEDLCRAWYHWPMTEMEREAFASGYREFGNPAAFERPSIFWQIVVLANSARFRLRSSRAAATAVLEKLKHLMATGEKS